MTDAELDEMERLDREGDAAPWEPDIDEGLWTGKWYTGDRRGSWATNGSDSEERERRNVALITAARNALPLLIAEVRRLRVVAAAAESYVRASARLADTGAVMFARDGLLDSVAAAPTGEVIQAALRLAEAVAAAGEVLTREEAEAVVGEAVDAWMARRAAPYERITDPGDLFKDVVRLAFLVCWDRALEPLVAAYREAKGSVVP